MSIMCLQLAWSHSSKFYTSSNGLLLLVLHLYLCGVLPRGHASLPFELLFLAAVSRVGFPLLVGCDDAHGLAVHALVHATCRRRLVPVHLVVAAALFAGTAPLLYVV